MKKAVLILSVVLIVAMAIMAAAPGGTTLARLGIWNRTDKKVNALLTTDTLHYYLTVKPDTYKVFTVERETYKAKWWACDKTASGTVDVETKLDLTFPPCAGSPNPGEPSMEKVHLKDVPAWKYKTGSPYYGDGKYYNLQEWRFQYKGYGSNPQICRYYYNTGKPCPFY